MYCFLTEDNICQCYQSRPPDADSSKFCFQITGQSGGLSASGFTSSLSQSFQDSLSGSLPLIGAAAAAFVVSRVLK
jgi:hypothetical protein